MTKSQKEFVVKSYAKYFGRAADADTIKYYGEKDNGKAEKASKVLNNIITDAGVYKGDIPDKQVVNEAFQNLFGRDAYTTEMNKYIKFVEKGKDLPINSIVKSAAKTDKAVYNNKMAVAVKYAELGGKGDLDLSKISKGNLIELNFLNTVTKAADLKAKVYDLPENSGVPSAFDGETIILTTNVDTGKDFVGTAKDDTFLSSSTGHWSVADSIDGGKGVDTLKIIDNGAITQADVIPTGSSIKNVEILDVIAGTTVVADTTSITGVTHLYTTSKGGNTSTAAATTDINVKETDLKLSTTTQLIVNGGKDITVNATGTTHNTTAFTPADGTGAEILVGATTAAAGKVTVTNSFASTTDSHTSGDVFVKGGTEVTVTQKLTNTDLNKTNVQGAVSVVGNASTKTVTVNQDATVAATATVVGKTAGAVTIADANATTTNAGTISTVTLKNAGNATVNSNALSTLNLEGTLTSVDASNSSTAATTGLVTTLALNLKGATSTGLVTADDQITTLNVNSSTTASTLNSLNAVGATTINVSGDAKLTISAGSTLTAVKDIVVTNTAGFDAGTTAIGAAVNFTGGAGDDAVVLSNNFTKAITMGAGNDKVTVSGTGIGTGGSVAAGEGKDTIVMTVADAAIFDNDSTFNTKFKGFETLELNTITGGSAENIDLNGINGVSTVNLATAVSQNGGLTLTNLVSNGKVKVTTNATTSLTIVVKDALLTNTDILNLDLSKTGTALTAGSITAANVETININVADAATLGSAAVTHALELAATSATSIVVAGNNGLTLTNIGNTKVTNFDASGVVANNTATTTDTAANLKVTFTSANTDAAANVSIKGGAGNDVLTGNASIDTITGGAGNDILAGAAGADIINVGEGRDAILINSFNTVGTDSGTASFDTINGFKLASAFTTSTDISDVANFQAATVGGANASVLGIDMDANGANGAQAIGVKGNTATAQAGQAIGVNYVIKDGILTLTGTGASSVDTLGEWLTEANAAAALNGDILAFQFGSDTYVFGQNGDADVFVKLAGVTGVAALAEGGAASTGVDNTLWFVDIA